jgi:hypothetical protein
MHGEFPYLKFLGGNTLVVGLNDRDFVQKPIRSAVLGNMLRAVGVENVAVTRPGRTTMIRRQTTGSGGPGTVTGGRATDNLRSKMASVKRELEAGI